MVDELQRLGRIVRGAREQKGLSQEFLADLAGLSRAYMGEVERGEANPSFLVLLKISQALKVEISELVRLYDRDGS